MTFFPCIYVVFGSIWQLE